MINCDDVIVCHVMQVEDHVMQPEDHVTTEKVVTNDTVPHPSATTNGSKPVEPHPSNGDINENSTTSEHHCSTLTNKIDHSITSSSMSEEVHTVSNEGHGDLSSVVNGRCSPVEKQQEEMAGLTSTQQQQSYSSKLSIYVTV